MTCGPGARKCFTYIRTVALSLNLSHVHEIYAVPRFERHMCVHNFTLFIINISPVLLYCAVAQSQAHKPPRQFVSAAVMRFSQKKSSDSSSYIQAKENVLFPLICVEDCIYKNCICDVLLCVQFFAKNLTPLLQARVPHFEERNVIRLYHKKKEKKTKTPSIHKVIKFSNHIHPFTPHVCLAHNIQCDAASLRLRSYRTHQRRLYVRDMVIISYYFCWKILRSRVIIKAKAYIALFTLKKHVQFKFKKGCICIFFINIHILPVIVPRICLNKIHGNFSLWYNSKIFMKIVMFRMNIHFYKNIAKYSNVLCSKYFYCVCLKKYDLPSCVIFNSFHIYKRRGINIHKPYIQ